MGGWGDGDPISQGQKQGLASATANGRLERTDATTVTYARYNGDQIEVNGESVSIGSGLTVVTTDNLISSTGTDSGAAMGASTLYYLYVSNSSASFAASDLRASATAPTRGTTDATTREGVYYLADSGNGANWRFVGWVRTDGSTNFVDTTTDRLVVNYYNRLALPIYLRPGYVDDDLETTFTHVQGADGNVFARLNGGTGSVASYIANGEDAVPVVFHSDATPAAGQWFVVGIGDNTTATAVVADESSAAGTRSLHSLAWSSVPATGYRTLEMIARTGANQTATLRADTVRYGGTVDPARQLLIATVMG